MNIKSLSFRQVQWAQELSKYYFRIDYWQSKTNRAIDALSYFFQKKQAKKNELKLENSRIFYKLRFSLTRKRVLGHSSFESNFSPLHRVFICGTNVFLQLYHFWANIEIKLIDNNLYNAYIGEIRLSLSKFQESYQESRKIKRKNLCKYKKPIWYCTIKS